MTAPGPNFVVFVCEFCSLHESACVHVHKGILMGTPNREPQEYSRNIIEDKDPGRYLPFIFLLCSWGCLFGVPIKVPLVFEVV